MHHILAFGIVLVALTFWIASVRRSLAGMAENLNNAMSQISVQLASEWEALFSLLELTKGYAPYESGTFIGTLKERRSITKDSSAKDICEQEKMIAETICGISEIAEEYADLKADLDYLKAKDAVHQYEKMVQTSKLIYNNSAAKFNHAVCRFPASMIAGILGFSNRANLEN